MLKRVSTFVAVCAVVAVAIAVALYAAGFSLVPAGSGVPKLRRAKSAEQQAAEIARHRQAQRASLPPAVTPTVPPIELPRTAPPEPGAASTDPLPAPYWTGFRGPARDGHYREQPILTDWPSAGLRALWKQPVGGGHASFAVAYGRAFTIEQRAGEEVVAAYDVATGRELWTNSWRATFSEYYGGEGPRATPTWSRGTLFALGATGELRAIDDGSGKTRWRTNILEDAGASNLPWGMAGSPLVVGTTVVVHPGGGNGRSMAAYDLGSGKRMWSALDDQAAYSSPMLVTLAGVEQIVLFTASRVVGLSPDGKRVLWDYPWPTQSGINVAQPIVIGDNRVFVSSGYGVGAGLIELSRAGDQFAVREVWRTNRMKNQFTSSVHHDGFIYGLDEAILACVDAATGELKWKGGRYGYGQLILASGHLIVVTEDGELALVRANPQRHEEIVRFPVLEGRTWNHPSLAGGFLLVRNATEMAAVQLVKR